MSKEKEGKQKSRKTEASSTPKEKRQPRGQNAMQKTEQNKNEETSILKTNA